jgi:hypothetical protein
MDRGDSLTLLWPEWKSNSKPSNAHGQRKLPHFATWSDRESNSIPSDSHSETQISDNCYLPGTRILPSSALKFFRLIIRGLIISVYSRYQWTNWRKPYPLNHIQSAILGRYSYKLLEIYPAPARFFRFNLPGINYFSWDLYPVISESTDEKKSGRRSG